MIFKMNAQVCWKVHLQSKMFSNITAQICSFAYEMSYMLPSYLGNYKTVQITPVISKKIIYCKSVHSLTSGLIIFHR
jgi:hypothetical protein